MVKSKLLTVLVLLVWLAGSFAIGTLPPHAAVAASQPFLQEQPVADRLVAYEETGHLFAPIGALASDSKIIYAASGNELLIISANSPNHPCQVAQPLDFSTAITDLHLSGDRLVVAAGAEGIILLDVSQALEPERLGALALGGSTSVVYSIGDRIYTVDANHVLHVIDASNPASMAERGMLALPGYVYTLAVIGDVLYASCGNLGIAIINIADPLNPAQVGSFDVSGDERKFVVAGSIGYLLTYAVDAVTNYLDLRLHSIDFSNPVQPLELDWLSVNGMGALEVHGDYAYLSFFYQISIVNIANPQQLESSGMIETDGTVSELLVDGSYGYASYSEGKLQVLDFSDPVSPKFVGNYQKAGAVTALAFSGSAMFLSLDYSTRISVYDLSRKGSAAFLASLDLSCTPGLMFASVPFLYPICSDGSLFIIDVSKPNRPIQVGTAYVQGGLRELAISGNRMYVLGYQEVIAFDISNPASPVALGSLATDAERIEANGNLVYLVKSNSGLSVVDASNPDSMAIVGTLPINEVFQGMAASGPYIYLSVGYYAYYQSALYVVDATQANLPVLVANISLPNAPTGLSLVGNRLFVPVYYVGFVEFDLRDPKSPALVNDLFALKPWTTLPPGEIFAIGDQIALANSPGGVTLLERVWTDRTTLQPDGQPYTGLAGKATFAFPAGSIANGALSVNYERANPTSLGGRLVAGPVFWNRMWDNYSEQPIQPSAPFSLTVSYDPALLDIIDESSIGLYTLQNGVWVLENGSSLHPATHTVTASPDWLHAWAVLGEPRQRIYLPIASRNHVAYPDLMLNRLEITQAVQRPDLSVPLVAGRRTVLRVHVSSDGSSPVDDVVVSVSASQNNLPLAGSPVTFGPWAVFPDPYAGNTSDSFNFSLPAEWLAGNLTLNVSVNPQKTITEASYSNNSQSLSLAFNAVPPLDYKIVPVDYTDEETGILHPGPTQDTMSANIWRMYPLHQINTSFRLAWPWSGDLSEGGEWSHFLDDLTDLKYSDEAPGSMAYYGAVKDAQNIAWAGMGWIGLRASVGIDYSETAAHELGHNFGRGHVPCGVDGDEDYPYPDGEIGQWGFDVYSNQAFPPGEYKDFMSYCGPEWVSDYTYMGLYEDQQESGHQSSAEAAPGSYYWIRLRFAQDGAVTLKPVYILSKGYALEGESSGYTAVLVGENGEDMQSYALPILRAISEGSEHTGIFATLPVPERGVRAIVIEKDGQEIVRQSLSPAGEPNLPEQVSVLKEPGGWRVSWRDSGTPVRVRVSSDGGLTWTTVGLDLIESELKIAENSGFTAGAWIEVSFANRSKPERIVLSAE